VNVTDECGEALKLKNSGRGLAFDDLDNDGRIDVVILNSNDRPTILRNESVTGNHWIQIRLRGVQSNRDGVGARVYVVAGDLQQMDEVHSGRGYQSHWGTRLHFGLAKNQRVERIEVHWPRSGVVDILEDVPVDRMLTIVEGSAQSKVKPRFIYPVLSGPLRK
ncbi:MAG: ASPIC/UnbV domain-containing protein, partial [Thermoguttaceae bacterium]